jgi:hypothetical protein
LVLSLPHQAMQLLSTVVDALEGRAVREVRDRREGGQCLQLLGEDGDGLLILCGVELLGELDKFLLLTFPKLDLLEMFVTGRHTLLQVFISQMIHSTRLPTETTATELRGTQRRART